VPTPIILSVWLFTSIGMMAIAARRVSEAEEFGNKLVALGNQHGFATILGFGLILKGWALAQRDESAAAVERLREGLAVGGGSRAYQPIFLGLLAEAHALAGEIEEGLVVLAEALAVAEASSGRGNNAELHRLRGDLLGRLPLPDWTEIEAAYRMALAVSREQGTRGFELRAAVSLAQLLSDRGHGGEAGDVLAPVYDWFTEGFDTQDLKDAKALLDKLS
jgi:predicted ATPase